MDSFDQVKELYKQLHFQKYGEWLDDKEVTKRILELRERVRREKAWEIAITEEVRRGEVLILKDRIDDALDNMDRERFLELSRKWKHLFSPE